MMRIDVHTHIFPPEVVRERERFFHGEAAFKLLYDSPKARLAEAEALVDVMERDGMDRSVVFGFPWQSTELTIRHNEYVLEAASRFAPRLIPMACVDVLGKEALREAERCLLSGAKGLGELAVYGPCDAGVALKQFEGFVGLCRTFKGVLLVHANEPVGHAYPGKAPLGLEFFYSLARLSKGVPLVLAHWGGGLCFYELLRKEAQEILTQVYYDTAASPFLYRPSIYKHMAGVLGAGKILFGSDFPLLSPRRCFKEMEEAGLAVDDIIAIGGRNAANLFGIDLPES